MPIPQQNWQALNLFLLLATQWRVADERPTGIDYAAIAPTARLADITLSTLLFTQIRTMEQVAIELFSTRKT